MEMNYSYPGLHPELADLILMDTHKIVENWRLIGCSQFDTVDDTEASFFKTYNKFMSSAFSGGTATGQIRHYVESMYALKEKINSRIMWWYETWVPGDDDVIKYMLPLDLKTIFRFYFEAKRGFSNIENDMPNKLKGLSEIKELAEKLQHDKCTRYLAHSIPNSTTMIYVFGGILNVQYITYEEEGTDQVYKYFTPSFSWHDLNPVVLQKINLPLEERFLHGSENMGEILHVKK